MEGPATPQEKLGTPDLLYVYEPVMMCDVTSDTCLYVSVINVVVWALSLNLQ